MDVLSIGVSCFDVLLQTIPSDIMARPLNTFDHMDTNTGGDGLNGSINMMNLGLNVAYRSVVGNDVYGHAILKMLSARGLSTEYIIQRDDFDTVVSIVLIDEQGERFFAGQKRTMSGLPLKNDDISDELLRSVRHVHCGSAYSLGDLDGEELTILFKRAKALGLTTSMDSGEAPEGADWMEGVRETLKYTDIFLPSHYEAKYYCGGTDDIMEMKESMRQAGVKIFGVKRGAEGVFVTDYKEDIWLPTLLDGKPVDTTGGGDAMCSGFVAGFVRGMSLLDSTVLGATQAAHVISHVGANAGSADLATCKAYAAGRGYDIDVKE